MSLPDLQRVIWPVTTALEAYVVGLVVMRGVYRILPVFSVYVCFILTKTIVLWALHFKQAGALYYRSYWAGEAIAFTLGFLIIIELFSRLLEDYPGLATFSRGVLIAVLGALVISCVLLAQMDSSPYRGVLLLLERSVRYVQVGLIIWYFAMSSYFRLTLHPWQRAIALGYGLFAAVELANYALLVYAYRSGYARLWAVSTIGAYLIALVVWAYYLTLSAPERVAPQVAPAPELIALEAEIRRRLDEVNRVLWSVFRGRAG